MRHIRLVVFVAFLLTACQTSSIPQTVPYLNATESPMEATQSMPSITGSQPPEQSQTPFPTLTEIPTYIPQPTYHPTPTAFPLIDDRGALPPRAIYRLGIGRIGGVDVSPDGSKVALGTTTGVYVYSIQGFQPLWRRYTPHSVSSVSWSPDGTRITADFGLDDAPRLYDASSGDRIAILPGWHRAVWSPDGRYVAVEERPPMESPSDILRLFVYGGQTGSLVHTLTISRKPWYGIVFAQIAWSPDSSMVAAAMEENTYLWDVSSETLITQVDSGLFYDVGERLLFSPGNKYLAISPIASDIVLIDTDNPAHREVISGEAVGARLRWQSTDHLLLYGISDIALSPMNIGVDVSVEAYSGQTLWSEFDSLLATRLNDESIGVIDGESGDILASVQIDPYKYEDDLPAVWLSSVRLLVTQYDAVFIWDWVNDEIVDSIRGDVRAYTINWQEDGQSLVLGSQTNHLLVWDLNTGEFTETNETVTPTTIVGPPPPAPESDYASVSPDGTYGVRYSEDTGCGDGPYGGGCRAWSSRLSLFLLTDNTLIRAYEFPSTGISHLEWRSDSEVLVVGLGQGAMGGGAFGMDHSEIILIRTNNGEEIARLSGHVGDVFDVAFSPDERRLASSSADGTVIVWDISDIP